MPNWINSLKSTIGDYLFAQQQSSTLIPAKLVKCLDPKLVKAIDTLSPDSPKGRRIGARCIYFEQLLLQGQLDIAKCEAELREMLNANIEEENATDGEAPKKTTCTDLSVPQQGLQSYDAMLQSSSMGANAERPQLAQFEMPKADYHQALAAQADARPSFIFPWRASADAVESQQKTSRELVSQGEHTRRTYIQERTKENLALIEAAKSRFAKEAEVYKHSMNTALKANPGHQQFTLKMKDLQQNHVERMKAMDDGHGERIKAMDLDHKYQMEALNKGMDHEYRMELLKRGKPAKMEKNNGADEQSQQEPIVEEPESEDDGEQGQEHQKQKEETMEG